MGLKCPNCDVAFHQFIQQFLEFKKDSNPVYDCYQLCPSCDGPIIMGFKIWSLQLCMGRYWLDSKLSRLLKSWNNLSHVSGKLKLFIYRFLLSVNYDRS